MPLFKFLRHRDLKDEIFNWAGRRDLNTVYAIFDQFKNVQNVML